MCVLEVMKEMSFHQKVKQFSYNSAVYFIKYKTLHYVHFETHCAMIGEN